MLVPLVPFIFKSPLLTFNGSATFITPEKKLFPGLLGAVPGFGFGEYTVLPILLNAAKDGPTYTYSSPLSGCPLATIMLILPFNKVGSELVVNPVIVDCNGVFGVATAIPEL